jgi:hypothetical protein
MGNQHLEDGFVLSYNNAIKCAKIIGLSSLILAPLLTFIGWAIAHESIGSFFSSFNLSWTPKELSTKLSSSSDPELIFRFFLFPHYFIYASMPFFVGLALCITYVSVRKAPWYSLVGLIFSIIGAIYFIGVLGGFLSNTIGTVKLTPILKISFVLCMLVFIGNIIQGFGLLKTQLLPKWASILFIAGNFLILIFPGIENWMAIGSLCMFVGLLPLVKILFLEFFE